MASGRAVPAGSAPASLVGSGALGLGSPRAPGAAAAGRSGTPSASAIGTVRAGRATSGIRGGARMRAPACGSTPAFLEADHRGPPRRLKARRREQRVPMPRLRSGPLAARSGSAGRSTIGAGPRELPGAEPGGPWRLGTPHARRAPPSAGPRQVSASATAPIAPAAVGGAPLRDLAARALALVPQMLEDAECHRFWMAAITKSEYQSASDRPPCEYLGDAAWHERWTAFYEDCAAVLEQCHAALIGLADPSPPLATHPAVPDPAPHAVHLPNPPGPPEPYLGAGQPSGCTRNYPVGCAPISCTRGAAP